MNSQKTSGIVTNQGLHGFRIFHHANQSDSSGFDPVYDPVSKDQPDGLTSPRPLSTLPHRCHRYQESRNSYSLDWRI